MACRWFENEALFRREWKRGNRAVERVAKKLRALGVECRITKPRFRKHVSERHSFARNDVDLWAGNTPLEVKGRRLSFTGPLDFPYGDVFVDTKRGWRKKAHRPAAVIVVSATGRGFLVVPVSTEKRWRVQRKRDHVRGFEDSFLVARRRDCKSLKQLAEWLKKEGNERKKATK